MDWTKDRNGVWKATDGEVCLMAHEAMADGFGWWAYSGTKLVTKLVDCGKSPTLADAQRAAEAAVPKPEPVGLRWEESKEDAGDHDLFEGKRLVAWVRPAGGGGFRPHVAEWEVATVDLPTAKRIAEYVVRGEVPAAVDEDKLRVRAFDMAEEVVTEDGFRIERSPGLVANCSWEQYGRINGVRAIFAAALLAFLKENTQPETPCTSSTPTAAK